MRTDFSVKKASSSAIEEHDRTELGSSLLADHHSEIAPLEGLHGWGAYHRAHCKDDEAQELSRIARHPPAGLHLLKYGSRSVVGMFMTRYRTDVCVKYYFPKHLIKNIRYGVLGSRCHQSWKAALAFNRYGIPTPAPLVIIERKRFARSWLEYSFLATRKARGIPLRDLVAAHDPAEARLERIAYNLRQAFAKMAHHRIVHGDLKATNILVDEGDNICFVDLDAAAVINSPHTWKRLRARDERIFSANWQKGTRAAEVFAALF